MDTKIAVIGSKTTGSKNCPPLEVITGSTRIFNRGKPVARIGDKCALLDENGRCIRTEIILTGTPAWKDGDMPVAREGDLVTDGSTIADGEDGMLTSNTDHITAEGWINRSFQQIQDKIYSKNCGETGQVKYSDNFTVEDEIILSTPQISSNMATKQESNEDSIAWEQLSIILKKWLKNRKFSITENNRNSPSILYHMLPMDLDWYMSYQRFKNKYEDLEKNSLNEKRKSLLVGRLKKIYRWGNKEKLWYFDFSQAFYFEFGDYYCNSRQIERQDSVDIDGMDALLASHMLYALPEGTVEYNEEDNSYKITVNNVYAVVRDEFNFDGNNDFYFF